MRVESCLTATSVGKEEEEESSETQENTMREQEGHDGVPRSNARGLPHSTVTFRHPPQRGLAVCSGRMRPLNALALLSPPPSVSVAYLRP